MRPRAEIDPELHTLRSVVSRADGRERQQIESARFNLYAAFEGRDAAAARRWASALRAALIAYEGPVELQALGLRALDTIEGAIGG